MTGHGEAQHGQLALGGPWHEAVPRQVLSGVGQPEGAQPVRGGRLVGDVQHEARRPGRGHAHAAVVDVGAVGQDGAGGSRRRDLRRVEVGVLGRAEVGPLHRDAGGQAARHHPGGGRLRGDVTQVDERLELLVARLVTGHHQGVVGEVGVEELLVAERRLRVLGTQHRLVEPGVGDPEQLLGQVDHAIVHDQVVERSVVEGEARHHSVRIDAKGLVASRVRVGRELLGRGEQRRQRRLGGRDGLGGQEPLHQAPALLLPLGLLRVADHPHQPVAGRGFHVCTMCQQTPWGGRWPRGNRHMALGGTLVCRLTTWYCVGPKNLSGP